jgi:MFS family permease
MAINSTLLALRSPAFRRYLTGQVPSVICSWIQVVAVSVVVVEKDPVALGWVVALQFLPALLLGPWFGAVVDRHDRRALLMLAEAGLGSVAIAYFVLYTVDSLSMGAIYALASVWGLFNALDTPARRTLIPALVPREQAARASSVAATGMLIGMMSGSAIGALLVARVGPAPAFTLNAASFLFDVGILATIRVPASPRVARAPGQIREGLRYVGRTSKLRDPLLALATIATLGFNVQASVPGYVRSVLHGGPALIGAALTAVTAGSLIGALGAVARGAPRPRTLGRTVVAIAVALATAAAAPNVPVAFIGLAGIGLAWSFLLGMVVATLQESEAAMIGRVMSLFATVLVGGMAIGGPIVTLEVAYAGPRAPFLVGAAAAMLVAVRGSTSRRGARMRQLPHRKRAELRPDSAGPSTVDQSGQWTPVASASSRATRSCSSSARPDSRSSSTATRAPTPRS